MYKRLKRLNCVHTIHSWSYRCKTWRARHLDAKKGTSGEKKRNFFFLKQGTCCAQLSYRQIYVDIRWLSVHSHGSPYSLHCLSTWVHCASPTAANSVSVLQLLLERGTMDTGTLKQWSNKYIAFILTERNVCIEMQYNNITQEKAQDLATCNTVCVCVCVCVCVHLRLAHIKSTFRIIARSPSQSNG